MNDDENERAETWLSGIREIREKLNLPPEGQELRGCDDCFSTHVLCEKHPEDLNNIKITADGSILGLRLVR